MAAHLHDRQLVASSWFEGTSLPDDPDVRPDSVHLVPSADLQVATELLGPRLTAIARTDRTAAEVTTTATE